MGAQMCQNLQLFYKVRSGGSRCQSKALVSYVFFCLVFRLFGGFLGNEVSEALKFPLGESLKSKSAKPQPEILLLTAFSSLDASLLQPAQQSCPLALLCSPGSNSATPRVPQHWHRTILHDPQTQAP